ncbi:methylenetetrahydrofolate reductase C-terminal domain-containing protein [Desulfomonile tiedjei]|uniref:Methylene-tetrahydrofolate reductase C terminal n=1 Tax=Desulfomonile tiedjei (strain ATCC 49306 / DSM 6799 / DCB-1) TaxID=706587 RepID=I4CD86_DESTA|nr:methylenetetrahydrofolate reductase C-terminal domain-containing protein [Desulfomonile tiedjei]AFM27527.1 Methylene-tetrahydrofolate reductase C terminal [Desulfomonile tiedjei DSM 6799]
MIGTARKSDSEILEALSKYRKIIVTGCNGCAKACKTGGEAQVPVMAEQLRKNGKEVVLEVVPERTCYINHTMAAFEGKEEQLRESDAILVLGCGGAVQIVRQATEQLGMTVPVKIGLNSVGHMDTTIAGAFALEQCQECGDCVLNETGGICPFTKCAKNLLNGPCGGAENGKCEVDRDRDCAWVLIYNRLAALGELGSLSIYREPKDYAKFNKPRSLKLA